MRTVDLVTSAVTNTFRSRTRTILTVLAIFVGAFTLTLTSGLGTGINAYIDDTVDAIGAEDAMTVTTASASSGTGFGSGDSGPQAYDPDTVQSAQPGPDGLTVVALTPDDLDALAGVDGVLAVEATKSIALDYVQAGGGDKYVAGVGGLVAGQTVQLTAGSLPDDSSGELEVVIPTSYVEPLDLTESSAVGRRVTIAVSDATGTQHQVEATVVGVSEESLAAPTGAVLVPNDALTDALYTTQNLGLPSEQVDRYAQATVWFAPGATDQDVDALKDRLADAGYTGQTVADQLGTFTAVIDGIVLVLNGFAVIALLAASFGIVNTLFMSVQERTREIGLMKAMGLGSGKVFGLFSLEASFIGLLGSALGTGLAMLAGSALSSALGGSLLADLAGLQLFAFNPGSIVAIIVAVMGIAFLAGTLPAARAANADPVDSLRYE